MIPTVISVYTITVIHRLVFLMEAYCVLCEVEFESLYIYDTDEYYSSKEIDRQTDCQFHNDLDFNLACKCCLQNTVNKQNSSTANEQQVTV